MKPRHIFPQLHVAEMYNDLLEHRGIVRDGFERNFSSRQSAKTKPAKVSDVCTQFQQGPTVIIVAATPDVADVKN